MTLEDFVEFYLSLSPSERALLIFLIMFPEDEMLTDFDDAMDATLAENLLPEERYGALLGHMSPESRRMMQEGVGEKNCATCGTTSCPLNPGFRRPNDNPVECDADNYRPWGVATRN